MKKNSLVEGTILASISLIIIKILGALYVIPFYDIVGELGGALYSYAYTIYNLIVNICITGIPVAVSKIVSEYNTLEMYEAKERTYKLSTKVVLVLSLILFAMMFIFAREFAYLFIGNNIGGNSINDIELVIRSISFCLLIVPCLAVRKGYLQGQKFISVSSTSQLIEQIVRIAFILVGSYLAINIYKMDVSFGVAIAVFGAFVAGVAAFLYLEYKIRKNKKELNIPSNKKKDKVSDKTILKKIFNFSIPLIIVSITMDIYNMTDLAMIIRALTYIGYNGATAETIASVMATWATKICLIVNAIASGLSVSLIPHMVSSLVKKDYKSVNNQFIKSLGIIIVIGLPMSVGISLLAPELYTIFYGHSEYGSIVLRILPFSILYTNFNFIISMVLQALNKFKTVYISTISGLVLNALLDFPLIVLCDKIGIYPYYGAVFATIIGTSLSVFISFRALKKEMDFRYRGFFDLFVKEILPLVCMVIVVIGVHYFISPYFNTRFTMLITCVICAIVGAFVYFFISYKNKLLYDVLGEEYINNILRKLRIKK